MTVVWQATIKLLEPDIEKLQTSFDIGSQISASIEEIDTGYRLRIGEYWTYFDPFPNETTTDRLIDALDWSQNQLRNWHNCKQLSANEWRFDILDDAKKFKTLFNLKWAA
jgi:hypothetical protein